MNVTCTHCTSPLPDLHCAFYDCQKYQMDRQIMHLKDRKINKYLQGSRPLPVVSFVPLSAKPFL